MDLAFSLEDEIIVEEYVKGREFSVAVIDGKALPVIEIEPLNGFYDYKINIVPVLQRRHVLPKLMKRLHRECKDGQKRHVRRQE